MQKHGIPSLLPVNRSEDNGFGIIAGLLPQRSNPEIKEIFTFRERAWRTRFFCQIPDPEPLQD